MNGSRKRPAHSIAAPYGDKYTGLYLVAQVGVNDEENIRRTLRERIAEARARIGMGQRDLALAVTGKAREATASDWETGKTLPTAVNLVRIAEVLGVTVAYLFGEDDGKPAPIDGERASVESIGDPERLKLLRMLTDVQSAVARGPATSQDEVFPDELGGPPTPEDQRVPTQERSRG